MQVTTCYNVDNDLLQCRSQLVIMQVMERTDLLEMCILHVIRDVYAMVLEMCILWY